MGALVRNDRIGKRKAASVFETEAAFIPILRNHARLRGALKQFGLDSDLAPEVKLGTMRLWHSRAWTKGGP